MNHGSPDTALDGNALAVRVARPEELFRVGPLFASANERPPAYANWLFALKTQPMERIVSALAWWMEGRGVKFLIGHQPGVSASQSAQALVPAMEALPDCQRQVLEYGRMLAQEEDVAPWLRSNGYAPFGIERVLEAPCTTVYSRIEGFLAKYRTELPSAWRTDPIQLHSPDTVWPLIAPYGLLKREALKGFWGKTGERGYDQVLSNILFDGNEPLGVLLVRTNPVCLAIDIRVVKNCPQRLRALANLALFSHIHRQATPETWRVVAFRADEKDHQETVRLAYRMGGREVAIRHCYSRTPFEAQNG